MTTMERERTRKRETPYLASEPVLHPFRLQCLRSPNTERQGYLLNRDSRNCATSRLVPAATAAGAALVCV